MRTRNTISSILFILIFLSLYTPAELFSQQMCTISGSSSNTPPFLPTTGANRALIVFVKFSDDTFGQNPGGGAECTSDSTTEWPYDRSAIPAWGNDIIDPTDSGTHTSGSITDYYCKMSRDRNDGTHGKFHLIGDVYPELIVPDHSRSWYENTSNHGFANEWIAVNREILTKVDNDPQGLDLSIYDDYTNGTTNRTPDGVFDMVVLIFRSHFGIFEGTARLDGGTSGSSSTQFGSLQIDTLDIDGCFETGSGIISQGYDQIDTIELLAHEYGHRIFGTNHLDYIGRFGTMDGFNGAGAMSAYERERAGWIAPQVISSDQSGLLLTESITTADIYKIFLPNSDEYLLLENRQNTFWTDTFWGDGDDSCDGIRLPGTGLLIAHIDPPSGTPTSLSANEIYWKRANGSSSISIGTGDDTDPYKPDNQIQLSPWTTPDSDTRNNTKTGIAINDVRFSGDDIVVDIDMNFASGALLENSTWSGAITAEGDFTLVSGKTLTIDPGATISFASGSTDLWVEGQIIAKGTSSNPITFTASAANPQPSEWGTIFVESDDNVFEHCTVEYSDLGIKIYDTTYLTGNVVKNCTIENNDQGLRFQNADVTVENNTIRDNRHGVVAIDADGDAAFPFLRNMLS